MKASVLISQLIKLILLVVLFSSCLLAQPKPKKILILVSTNGMGHVSAADAIKMAILKREGGTEVTIKVIQDFYKGPVQKIEEKLRLSVFNNYPKIYDKFYSSAMAHGNQVSNVGSLNNRYDSNLLLKFIKESNPDVIIAAHYASAVALIELREKGELENIKIVWVHTDYLEGYFPRISKAVDQTFLPKQLEEVWKANGVPEEKIQAVGIPLSPTLFESVDKISFMTERGLDPNIKTIVLAAGGANGSGHINFADVVTCFHIKK